MSATGEQVHGPTRAAPGSQGDGTPARRAIGWIGFGAIGLPMAARAVAAGWTVLGFDPSPMKQEAARAAGINVVPSTTDAASQAEGLVVCVVRTLEQVDSALLGEGEGVLRRDDPPLGVVMSTVGALGLEELAERASRVGGRVVDAPILGNPHGAAAGALTILVSGWRDDVASVRPLFDDIARSVVVLGEAVGLAQTVKTVSQLRQIAGMLATIEGVELAVRRGADEQVVLDVLHATEPSWATDNWVYASELWSHRDRTTSLGIFAKDLAAAVSDAEAVDVDVPIAREAHRVIESRLADGGGGC